MKILFIHQGFPGQFKNLVPALLERRDQVFVLSSKVKPLNLDPRIHYFRYVVRRGNTSGIHSLVLETESKVIRAEALANEALRLRDQGLAPDPYGFSDNPKVHRPPVRVHVLGRLRQILPSYFQMT